MAFFSTSTIKYLLFVNINAIHLLVMRSEQKSLGGQVVQVQFFDYNIFFTQLLILKTLLDTTAAYCNCYWQC